MNGFWNKMGDTYLRKIEIGTLEVTYPTGEQKVYGNGEEPRVAVHIHDSCFFRRLALYGDIGFAESYMDGDFDCDNLHDLIKLSLLNSKQLGTKSEDYKQNRFTNLLPNMNRIKHIMRKNSKTRSSFSN
jgi:cyclopropane-fatty-acyl-phospholipid synthase